MSLDSSLLNMSITIGDKNEYDQILPQVKSSDQKPDALKSVSVVPDSRCSKYVSYLDSIRTLRLHGYKIKEIGTCNILVTLINIYNEVYSQSVIVEVLPCSENCVEDEELNPESLKKK